MSTLKFVGENKDQKPKSQKPFQLHKVQCGY